MGWQAEQRGAGRADDGQVEQLDPAEPGHREHGGEPAAGQLGLAQVVDGHVLPEAQLGRDARQGRSEELYYSTM